MNILGYALVMTCGACPEQYDINFEGKTVGYAPNIALCGPSRGGAK